MTTPLAYTKRDEQTFVPGPIAKGGWGPTVGGHVVGGLLARACEQESDDADLQPARLTVEILRRVALEPVTVTASTVRQGKRMKSVDAVMTQDGQVVARASTLFLRRGDQPAGPVWTSPITMPPAPSVPETWPATPMFIKCFGREVDGAGGFEWQHDGPKFAWIHDFRQLIEGEPVSPFVRAALAVDVTSSLTNFGPAGLDYINADFTLSLCRLPVGLFVGLAAVTHYSADGIATGAASLFDADGPIGTGTSVAIANPTFAAPKSYD